MEETKVDFVPEKEAKNSIMACYMKAKTYEQKNK